MKRADDLRLWRIFVMIADMGSFVGVADEEGVELSTISRAMAQLEKMVGHQLIQRGKKPIELTELGKLILPRVRNILELQESLLDDLKAENSALEGEVRLSTSQGFAATKLPFYLAKFNELYPHISFRVMPGKTIDDVVRGQCDIAVKTGEVSDSNVVKFYRGHNFYLPLASPEYLKKHKLPLEPADLEDHTVYVYSGPVRGETDFLSKGNRIEKVRGRSVIHMPSIQAIHSAALAGLGVAVDLTLNKCLGDVLA